MKSALTQAAETLPERESPVKSPVWRQRLAAAGARHPVLTILCVSLVAVMVNCYPVIFCGKSFVALQVGPTHGSDVAAMLVWSVPAGFIESRSIWNHGELPLWDRYGHAGAPFIGQAITMLGDPLQWMVILGHGSAWAWDMKFLTAKFLFCAGFGLLIRRLLGGVGLALLYAALAAYCGAFFYINNHPVFFVFCDAPWILLSALEWLAGSPARRRGWGLVWLLANFACFNAGHVEVAVVLIGGLNLAALAWALTGCQTGGEAAARLARLAAGTLLFLGLTAPVWMSFLVALKGAYSAHEKVEAVQLPFLSLPGAVDDLFYLLMRPDVADALAPGTSLLVLVGCVLSAAQWRYWSGDRFFWINSSAIFVWGGLIFGWLPGAIIKAVPLLNRVGHTQTDFSYLLAMHLTLQSAYGFKGLTAAKNFRGAAAGCLGALLVFALLLLGFDFGISHRPIPWNYFVCAAAGAAGAPLLFAFLKFHYPRMPAAGWAGVVILGFIPQFRFGLYSSGNGQMLLLPGPRTVLNPASPVIEKIKSDRDGPFRIAAPIEIFFGDYAAVYGLEDIRSCAPLSNGEFIRLIRHSPGLKLERDWMIDLLDPPAAQPLLNLLNVKYLLADQEIGPRTRAAFPVVEQGGLTVLENPQCWPRAFFSDRVVALSSTDEFIRYLQAHGTQPFIALTPGEIQNHPGLRALKNTAPGDVAPATNYQLLPNSTAFDIHATSAGVVCLTEGQARDFTATANGQVQAVLTVNRAFKGIYLDRPGRYHIVFTYRPRYWRLACLLFWLAAGTVVALTVTRLIRARRSINPTPLPQ